MHLRKDLSIRHTCGLHVIYVPAFSPSGRPIQGTLVDLNETGVFLWEQLQPKDHFTLQDMADILQKEYEIDPETAMEDCQDTLTEWTEMGLVEK